MTTYYVRDRSRGGAIVNAVETNSADRARATLRLMEHPDDLYVDPDPPTAVLAAYRYWNERP